MSKRMAKRYTRLALEKRIVFDAAAVQTAADIADTVDNADTDALVTDLSMQHENTQSDILFDILTAPATETKSNRDILIVDSRVENYETLLVDLAPDTDVFVLNADQDGIEQINTILANYQNLSSLQILSHADDATLVLGDTVLNNTNIDAYADTLSSWGQSLADSGDILLFGCDVANDAKGHEFIQSLANYTRADVAASSDYTGNAEQGGDWDLEVEYGAIEAKSVLSEQAQAGYNSVLAAAVQGPAPMDDNFSVDEDTTLSITIAELLANDDPSLAFNSIDTMPANGTLTFTDFGVDYTPNANFNGTDSFSYTVIDQFQQRQIATVTITVNSVADTLTWTNATGDNRWETAGNWDLGFTPGNGDDVIIPDQQGSIIFSAGSGTVTLNSLTSSEDDFRITGGTLLLGDDANDTSSFANGTFVTLSGGELGGLGNTSLAGDVTFSGGTLSGDITVETTGSILFNNTFSNSNLSGTVTNSGTVEFSANSSRLLGATIVNNATGVIDLSGSVTISIDAGTTSIANNGSIIKSAGGGEGRFNVLGGSALNLSGSGVFDSQTGILVLEGTTNYAADFSASGVLGGTAFRLNNGLHTFTAGSSINDGAFVFRGGTIAGELNIASDATLTFNDQFRNSDLSGRLNNLGLIEFSSNSSRIIDGTINNTGTIDFTSNVTVTNSSGSATIINNGSIIKSAGASDARFFVTGGASGFNFSGAGIYDAQSGTLSIEGNANYDSSFSASGGTGPNALRLSGGVHNFSTGASFNNGVFTFRGGELSGELDNTVNARLIFNDQFRNSDLSGILNNAGVVQFASNSTRILGGTLNNQTGATVDFSADITVSVDLDSATGTRNSSIINNGTIVKTAGAGDSRFNILSGAVVSIDGNGVYDAGAAGTLSFEGDANYASTFSASGNAGSNSFRLSNGTHNFLTGSALSDGNFFFRGGVIAGELGISNNAMLLFIDQFRNSDLTGTLRNAGTISFDANSTRLRGGTIDNQASGSVQFTRDLTVTIDSGASSIINNGAITKTAGTGDSRFNTVTGSSLNFSGTGSFDAGSGSLSIEGNTNYAANFVATGGAGQNSLQIGNGLHTFSVGSRFTNGNFLFRGGTLAGELMLDSSAKLSFVDQFRNSDLTGTLRNAGTISFDANSSRLRGGTIDNQATGTVEFSRDLTITVDSGASSIINNGSFIKTAGTGDSRFNTVAESSLNLSGSGTFDAGSGTLSLDGTTNYASNFVGSDGVGPNALRIASGLHTFTAGSRLATGNFIFSGGNIAGDLAIDSNANLIFTDQFRNSDLSGRLNNSGTITFSANSSRILGGTLNNLTGGVIDFTSDLTLTLNGANTALINNGSVIKSAGGGDSRLLITGVSPLTISGDGIFNAVTGSLSLAGNVNYASGFIAAGNGISTNALRITSGVHNFGAGSTFTDGDFIFFGGEIAGDLTLTNTSSLISNNSSNFSDFTGTLDNSGSLVLSAANSRFFGATLTNSGTVTLGNTISISNGTINNSGIIDFTTDSADIRNNAGILTVINNGSLIKTVGNGESTFFNTGGQGFAFSGNGVIDARTGFIGIEGNTNYANNFTLSGGTGPNALRIGSGVHTFGANSSFNNGTFTFRGGAIAGDLTLAANATLLSNDSARFSDITGRLTNNGLLDITRANTRILGGTITNIGTISTTNSININNGTLINSGTFDFAGDGDLVNIGGSFSLTNTGTIVKTAGTGDSLLRLGGGADFDISGNGVIDARTGFISIEGNANYASNFSVTGGQGANALRIGNGTHTFGANSSFNNGTFTFRGGAIAGDLTIASDATLLSNDSARFSDITGTLTNNGLFDISRVNTRLVNGTLVNNNTVTTSDNITATNATINNSGLIEFTTDADLLNASGTLNFINNGSLIKTGGGADTLIRNAGGQTIAMSGNGVIDAQTGFISIEGNTTYANNFTLSGGSGPNSLRIGSGLHTFGAGSSFNSGTFLFRGGSIAGELTINSDANLTVNDATRFSDFSGTLINKGLVQITSSNARIQSGSFINDAGGTLELVDGADITTNGAAATLTNAGTITNSGVSALSTITNGTSFSNNGGIIDAQTGTIQLPDSGTSTGYILQGTGIIDLRSTTAPITDIRPGNSPGILNIVGSIDIDPVTTLSIEIGGPTAGNTAADHDQIQLSGTANFNGGTINVSFLNNYGLQLTEGQVFTIATYTASVGPVSSLLVKAPQSIGFRLNDTGTSLQLIVDSSVLNQAPVIATNDVYQITNTSFSVSANNGLLANDQGDNLRINLYENIDLSNSGINVTPGGIAYDRDTNTLFIGEANQIFQVDLQGQLLNTFNVALTDIFGITVDPVSGNLIVSESLSAENGGGLYTFDTTTQSLNLLLQPVDPNGPAITDIDGVVVDPSNGNLLFVDDSNESIYTFDRQGNLLNKVLTTDINPNFDEPQGIAIDPVSGNIFVADDDRGTVRLYILDSNGNLLDSFNTASLGLIDPGALSYDAETQRLFILDDEPVNQTSIAVVHFSNTMTTSFGGTVSLNSDGSFDYSLGNASNDSFQYIIYDNQGSSSTGQVSLVNSDPVANDDSVSTSVGTAVTFNVLDNDFDPDEQRVSVVDFTQPVNGTLVESRNGSFTYTPDEGFEGQDTFTYTITDGVGGIDVATVTLNTLPVEVVNVRGDGTSTTNVFTDPVVTFTQGNNGRVTDNGDGTFTYQPNQGFRGMDSFTVTTTVNGVSVDRVVDVNVLNNVVSQNWTGQAGDGDWSNPANWDLGLTPADGDSVSIPDGADVITFTSGNVTLQTLNLSDTLIVQNGVITVMGDATIQNNGVLDIAAGQVFAVDSGDFINNGTINGKGTLDVTQATSFINNGVLSPGNSPGSLTVNGNLTQTTSGTILLEIAGLTPGTQYDQLIVNGTATLNGTVDIVLLNGFVLPATGNFQLISATSISGSPLINTPTGVTFDLFTGSTTSSATGGFTGTTTGTFTFGPTSTGTGGFISISSPTYTYEPIQVASTESIVTPIDYQTVTDSDWINTIDDLTVALVDESSENDALIAEFEALLENEPTAAGDNISEYELKLEQQIELAMSQFSKEQMAVLEILLQTPDTLSCR